jgi:hypothetical protein
MIHADREPDAAAQIVHGHMYVKPLHEVFLFRGATGADRGAQLRPAQQFSVRKPSSAFIWS